MPAPDLRGGNAPTLMEKYPAAAYKLDTDLGWRDGTDKLLNGIANIVFSLVVGIGVITSRLVQWVFSFNLFEHTGGSIPSVVGELARNLYQPFVIPMIVIAAGWMAWHGLARRRASMATEGAVWVVAALAVAVWFLAAPQAIVNGANGISTGLSRAVLSGMGRIDPRAPLPDNGGATPSYAGDPADNELRSAGNTYWTTFVYTPWLVAEFGSVETGQKYGPQILSAKSANEHNLNDRDQQDAWARGDKDALVRLKNDEYGKAQKQTKDGSDEETRQSLNGHRAAQRVGISLVALLVITLASVFMLIIAGAVLMASIGLLMLVLTAPIFLLLGIHPTTGRRVFLKWAELCVGTLIKRVAYAAFLSVVMTVMGILLAGALRIGWGVAAALAVAVFVAGLIYRKPFMAIFSAMGSFSMSTSGESGMGSRLAAGLGGAYLGSRLARRQSSNSSTGAAPGVAVPTSRSLYGGAHQGAMPASGVGGTPGVNGDAGKAGLNGAGGTGGAAGAGAAPGAGAAAGAAGGATVLAGAALAGGAMAAEKLRGPMNELAAAAQGSDSGGSPGGTEVAATAAGAHLRHLHGGRSPIPAETAPTRSLNGHGADGDQS